VGQTIHTLVVSGNLTDVEHRDSASVNPEKDFNR
jgi:hypothetical protein